MQLCHSLALVLCSFTVVACSGNGFNIPPGTQCDPTFAQADIGKILDTKGNSKLTMPVDKTVIGPTAQTTSDLRLGTYNFAYADIAYSETKSPTLTAPLELSLHDDLATEVSKEGKSGVGCVANPKFVLRTQDLAVTFPSAITVNDETGVITVTPRTMALQFRPTQLLPQKTIVGTPYAITDLSQIIGNGTKPKTTALFATAGVPNDYQFVANYDCPSDEVSACSFTVTVHMTYAPPLTPDQKIAKAKADADKKAKDEKAKADKIAADKAAADKAEAAKTATPVKPTVTPKK